MGPGSQLVHSQAVPAALGLVHPRQAAGYGNHIFDTNALEFRYRKLSISGKAWDLLWFVSLMGGKPAVVPVVMHVVMACDNFVGLMAQETISWAKTRCSWRTFTYKGTLFLALAPQKSSSVKCAALAISLEFFPLARSIVTGTLRNLIAARAAFSLIVTVSPKMVSSPREVSGGKWSEAKNTAGGNPGNPNHWDEVSWQGSSKSMGIRALCGNPRDCTRSLCAGFVNKQNRKAPKQRPILGKYKTSPLGSSIGTCLAKKITELLRTQKI